MLKMIDEDAANASFLGAVAALSGGGPNLLVLHATSTGSNISKRSAQLRLNGQDILKKILPTGFIHQLSRAEASAGCTRGPKWSSLTVIACVPGLQVCPKVAPVLAGPGSTGDEENSENLQILANSTKTSISLTKAELAIQKEAKARTKERKKDHLSGVANGDLQSKFQMAQTFTNGKEYVVFFSVRGEARYHDELSCFIHEVGILEHLVTDGAKAIPRKS
eukprot:jgi/Psemu1/22328/gm1.22328_g